MTKKTRLDKQDSKHWVAFNVNWTIWPRKFKFLGDLDNNQKHVFVPGIHNIKYDEFSPNGNFLTSDAHPNDGIESLAKAFKEEQEKNMQDLLTNEVGESEEGNHGSIRPFGTILRGKTP